MPNARANPKSANLRSPGEKWSKFEGHYKYDHGMLRQQYFWCGRRTLDLIHALLSVEYDSNGIDTALHFLSLYEPSRLISKFCGFRSRCSTRWWWQYARPVRSWYKKDFTIVWSMPPSHTSKYFFKSWSRYSKTRVKYLAVCTTSYSLYIVQVHRITKWSGKIGKIC